MPKRKPSPASLNRSIKGSTHYGARSVRAAITQLTTTTTPSLTPTDDAELRKTCRNCKDAIHVPDERTGLIHVTGKYVCDRGVKYGKAERIYVAEQRSYFQ